MEFVAIDVETANADMASICQIGLALFFNGQITSEWKTYVDPKDRFDGINKSIHGIDEAMVAGAPTFDLIAEKLKAETDGKIVVTHTAFDRVALGQAATKHRAVPMSCRWMDSACVARRAWKEFSKNGGYGLRSLCEAIDYKFQHHDALEDAKAAGNIMLAAMAQTGLDLDAWITRVKEPINPKVVTKISRHGNPDGELYGEVMVFTGALSLPRHEAADLAAISGCEVGAGVTKHTTILVVGDQDIHKLSGHEKSSKHRKAEKLIGEGHAIRIVRETDFRELVALSL